MSKNTRKVDLSHHSHVPSFLPHISWPFCSILMKLGIHFLCSVMSPLGLYVRWSDPLLFPQKSLQGVSLLSFPLALLLCVQVVRCRHLSLMFASRIPFCWLTKLLAFCHGFRCHAHVCECSKMAPPILYLRQQLESSMFHGGSHVSSKSVRLLLC